MNLSLSHIDSESEIPEGFETEQDVTKTVTISRSRRQRIVDCLTEAGGESLSVEDIAEGASLSEESAQEILTVMSRRPIETREIFEDENEPGCYFLTSPLLDHLAVGTN